MENKEGRGEMNKEVYQGRRCGRRDTEGYSVIIVGMINPKLTI